MHEIINAPCENLWDIGRCILRERESLSQVPLSDEWPSWHEDKLGSLYERRLMAAPRAVYTLVKVTIRIPISDLLVEYSVFKCTYTLYTSIREITTVVVTSRAADEYGASASSFPSWSRLLTDTNYDTLFFWLSSFCRENVVIDCRVLPPYCAQVCPLDCGPIPKSISTYFSGAAMFVVWGQPIILWEYLPIYPLLPRKGSEWLKESKACEAAFAYEKM